MKRKDLEHIIRAAGSIAGENTVVIVGSQAILGYLENPPTELMTSMEADIFIPRNLNKSDLIDGAIGEYSIFHETFGYYAHGIEFKSAALPKNWMKRTIKIKNKNTQGITGICLHPIDIAVSKLIAGRAKDIQYIKIMLRHDIINISNLIKITKELSGKNKKIFEKNIKLFI